MVAETGERNIVVGVDAQFVSKRLSVYVLPLNWKLEGNLPK